MSISCSFSFATTISMIAPLESIPVLTTSVPMSLMTASICEPIAAVGSSTTPRTSRVFWAVTAVITDVPYTPIAANDFRSACIPAPPPESDPAIVIARATAFIFLFSMT